MPERIPPKLLITDLDNTLYDWFDYFVPSIYCMISRAADILGISHDELTQELRTVHQRHHDVEHPFALLETETVSRLISETSLPAVASQLDPAFHEFNKARIRHLEAYPTVHGTLEKLRERGVALVAYSESKKHAVMDRLRRLSLLDFFDRVYCRESSRSLHPDPERAKKVSDGYPREKLVEQPLKARKPAPEVLLDICEREGFASEEAVYIGDSRVKDVLMANRAGVLAVWARYGDLANHQDYERLVAISHWTAEDVARERMLRSAERPKPDLILKRNFGEVERLFQHSRRRWKILPSTFPTRNRASGGAKAGPKLPVAVARDSS